MRIKQLDILRAVATLLVIGHHLTWNPLWSRFGWTGVDLFFVLSGFLVSGLLFREYKASGEIHALRFLGRRGFKIYPSYYFLIAATVVVYAAAGNPMQARFVWRDVFFLQSYAPGTWGHLWSLAVEEHFYLMLPVALCLLVRKGKGQADPFRRLPVICCATFAACYALRLARFLSGAPFDHYANVTPTHLRLDALAFGVLLSYLWEFRPTVIESLFFGQGRFLLAVSVVLMLPALLFRQEDAFMNTAGLTMLYAGHGGLLLYCLRLTGGPHVPVNDGALGLAGGCIPGGLIQFGRLIQLRGPIRLGGPTRLGVLIRLGVRIRGLLGGVLARIGAYSYTIYLCHLPIAYWAVGPAWSPASLHWGRTAIFFTYLLVSVAAGVALSLAVERPALRLRERVLPARRKAFPARAAEPVSQFTPTATRAAATP